MFLLVAALTVAPIPPEARHDADCAEAASWALSWMGNHPHDEAIENVRNVSYFYFGRLSLRGPEIDWVMSLSRDMNANPRPTEQTYSARLMSCTDEMTSRFLTSATNSALSHLPRDPPGRR
jgi:hypothetical protein